MRIGERTARLLAEAIVLAYVEGSRWGELHGRDGLPSDSEIVGQVLAASVSMPDIYPMLSKTYAARTADAERRRRSMELLAALVQGESDAHLS